MKKKAPILLVFLSAIIFTCLFHRQALGLNLFLFELLLFIWFTASGDFRWKGKSQIISGLGFLTTALFTVLTYSIFAYVMNFVAVVVYLGILIYPDAKSFIHAIGLSLNNLLFSQIHFFNGLVHTPRSGRKISGFLWKSRIFTIPVFVIMLFIVIYGIANPVFGEMVGDVGDFIGTQLDALFKNFDELIVLTFLLGILISNLFFWRKSNQTIVDSDFFAAATLTRQKIKARRNFKLIALKNEYKAGIFLLAVLNVLLLTVNIIDINWVWFHFDWEAQDLKQFVHEGTYLLILSILISGAVVLILFRGNLNFYTHNKHLKYLSYIWIAQNGILTVSVAIRNFYYIQHFSLAYKRIGVILFLLLTLYGLYTVALKVRHRKTAFQLIRSNAYAIYVVLVISACINWDNVIARYNFNHADKSFLHLEFLSTLSDKSLPLLDKSLAELTALDAVQDEKFPFAQHYMNPDEYHLIIKSRKKEFIQKWEEKGILEWNLPEYLAYRRFKGTD